MVLTGRGGRVLAGLAFLAGLNLAMVAPPGTSAAAAVASTSSSGTSGTSLSVGLLGQTTWATPGQPFGIQFSINGTGPGPGSLEIEVAVYEALSSRSAFHQSQAGHDLGAMLWSHFIPLSQVSTVPGGYATCVPVDMQPAPACPGPDALRTGGQPGVYPVVVSLRNSDTGVTQSRLFTHLIIVPGAPATNPLSVALVVPVAAQSPLQTNGRRRIAGNDLSRLSSLAAELSVHGSVPVTLEPEPSALAALADTPSAAARATLNNLKKADLGAQVLAATFAPAQPAQLVAADLFGELRAQVSRGGDVVGNELGARPSPATWLLSGPIDHSTAAALQQVGVQRLVVPGSDLQSQEQSLTTAEPFRLDVGGSSPTALAEDGALSSDLALGTSVLGVHELLADLAQIYFESPNLSEYLNGAEVPEKRGVVVLAPDNWSFGRAAAQALYDGLATSPIVRAGTVDDLFSRLGDPNHTRQAQSLSGHRSDLQAAEVRKVRALQHSLAASVQGSLPQVLSVGDLILTSESVSLTSAERSRYLAGARAILNAEMRQVTVAASALTLTSRQGKVPISIISGLPHPVKVRVVLSSTRLAFAGASGRDSISRAFTLSLRNTTWLVPVTARTTGSFDVSAHLYLADGGALVDSSHIAITSRAFSGVGVVLSVVALAVLAFWWGRALQKGRRNRALAPKPQ